MRTLLLFILAVLIGCNNSHDEKAKQERIKTARRFVELIASYEAENVRTQFEEAKSLLTEPALNSFGEGIMKADLAAIESVKRKQEFQIAKDGIEYQELDDGASEIAILGSRVRTVNNKNAKPIELAYFLIFPQGESKLISEVAIQISGGQQKAVTEEKLLERFNEASGAAKEERKKFVEAVQMVSEDLKAHEEKVEKDFNRLSTSLDKLGGTVRKLKDEAIELRKKRSQAVNVEKKNDEPKKPAPTSKTDKTKPNED